MTTTLQRLVPGALVAGALALGACGADDGDTGSTSTSAREPYPANVKANFMRECKRTSDGNVKGCQCILDAVEKKMTLTEFKQEDTAVAMGRTPSRRFSDAVAQCR